MDNNELNAVVYVLKRWAKGECGLGKPALVTFHNLLIKDLAIHRKIKYDVLEKEGEQDG